MPPTVKVQRGSITFGSSSDSTTTGFADDVASLTKAFARITAVIPCSRGVALGDTVNKNNDDLGMTCELTAIDTITFTRQPGGEDQDYRAHWEVVEYIGPAGGPDEFVVTGHGTDTLSDGVSTLNPIADSGVAISYINDCVPFITGLSHDGTGRDWDDVNVTAKAITLGGPIDTIEIQRGFTTGDLKVSWAMLEFIGSNYIIQNNKEHGFSSAGANETEAITAVSAWDKAFIVPSMRSASGEVGLEDSAFNIWPGATTSTVRYRMNAGADNVGNVRAVAHVVENPGLNVIHDDSITGGGTDIAGGSGLQLVSKTISAPRNSLSECSALGTADSDGSGALYPQHLWGYRLTTNTDFQFSRGRGGTTSEWALQGVGWPQSPRRMVVG